MYKLLIFVLFMKISLVFSCSTQSTPSCQEKTYKNYEERNDFMKKLPSSRKINHISLIGTHQSLSYLSGNIKNKTQELDILFQLKHGIRVIDMSVEARGNDNFAVHSGSLYLPQIFDDTLKKISKFLEYNNREFVILILHDDNNVNNNNNNNNNCKIIDQYMKKNENISWRIVKDWNFDDLIGIHRGKILLATLDSSFNDCAVNFRNKCKFDNSTASSVAEKWLEIVNFQEKCYLANADCFFYQLSIDTAKNFRANAKYGGYFENKNCIEPINSKMAEFFYSTKRGLFIVLADYVTQELIDRVNTSNNHTLETMYYWEKVKRKFLYDISP